MDVFTLIYFPFNPFQTFFFPLLNGNYDQQNYQQTKQHPFSKAFILVRPDNSSAWFSSPLSQVVAQSLITLQSFRTMDYSFYDKIYSSRYDDLDLFNQTLHNFAPSNGLSSPHSLVLEGEKEKVAEGLVTEKVGKDEVSEVKGLASLKNHREAERRRRERINGHLGTLRGLLDSTHQKVCFCSFLAFIVLFVVSFIISF